MKKNGDDGSGVICPHCGGSAAFHSHRPHTSLGKVLFPFGRDAGMTTRDPTPALKRVATLAGTVADSFEKGADLLDEMAGVRVSESSVARTTQGAGSRLAKAVEAGKALSPKVDWVWPKDYQGKRRAHVALDATGVRRQGENGGPAEGRMAYVGMVCNPDPEWPWPEEESRPMRSGYLSGLYPLEEFAPLMRPMAGRVGMDQAERWIGLTDGGTPRTRRSPRSRPGNGVGCSSGRGRDAGGGAGRMGLAKVSGIGRGGQRVGRLPRAARAWDGVPRIPGQGLVHRQRCGGSGVQNGGGAAPQARGDALGARTGPMRSATSAPCTAARRAGGKRSGAATSAQPDHPHHQLS